LIEVLLVTIISVSYASVLGK